MKIDIINTIQAINPNAVVSVSGDDINQIEWLENTTPISVNQILAKQIELQAEYDSKEYQRNRANEYPDFKEYLDGIVKGDDAQIQKYINDCLAVKAKYPKE
jgi:hypothetical protein